ncbi:MAG: hypothetical protein SPiBPW_32490 [Shewanella algae]
MCPESIVDNLPTIPELCISCLLPSNALAKVTLPALSNEHPAQVKTDDDTSIIFAGEPIISISFFIEIFDDLMMIVFAGVIPLLKPLKITSFLVEMENIENSLYDIPLTGLSIIKVSKLEVSCEINLVPPLLPKTNIVLYATSEQKTLKSNSAKQKILNFVTLIAFHIY